MTGVSLEESELMRVPAGGGGSNEVRKAMLAVGFVFVQVAARAALASVSSLLS